MPRRTRDADLALRLGARLRHLRESCGLTQQALADRIRSTAPTVSRIESGSMMPTLTTVSVIARALGLPMSTLFDFGQKVDTRQIASESAAVAQTDFVDRYNAAPAKVQAAIRTLLEAATPKA
jgi:transcriptional regulator with XRE-family HTH domain